MENVIVIAILVLILGGSVLSICKAKKRGVKCIGCPNGASCAGKCGGGCAGCSGGCGHPGPKSN